MNSETESETNRGVRWQKRGLLILAWFVLVGLGQSVMVWQVERFAMKAYRIPSSNMEPTLHCARPAPGCAADSADRVLVSRLVPDWTPSRGDLIAFRTPRSAVERCGAGGTFLKRIVGLPGERIRIRVDRGAAFVYVDARRLEEPYIERHRRDSGPPGSFTVPEDAYFVMGDNRAQSCDSRVFGAVPRDHLVGPVVARYWPFERIGSP